MKPLIILLISWLSCFSPKADGQNEVKKQSHIIDKELAIPTLTNLSAAAGSTARLQCTVHSVEHPTVRGPATRFNFLFSYLRSLGFVSLTTGFSLMVLSLSLPMKGLVYSILRGDQNGVFKSLECKLGIRANTNASFQLLPVRPNNISS